MDIDEKGKVIGSQIAETVICVDQRMTYTSVKKILEDQDAEEIEKYQEFVPMFEKMRELSELLRKNRHARGSIDFDFPEAKIILDKKGKPVDIRPYEANTATKIIEDFMLLANETVASEYLAGNSVFIPCPRYTGSGKNPGTCRIYPQFRIWTERCPRRSPSKRTAETPLQSCRFTGRGTDQSFDPAFHETGEVFDRMYRTFRTGSEVLHAFHFSDPSVSGSADSPDHQGKSAWQIKCRADRTLSGDPAGSGRTFQ